MLYEPGPATTISQPSCSATFSSVMFSPNRGKHSSSASEGSCGICCLVREKCSRCAQSTPLFRGTGGPIWGYFVTMPSSESSNGPTLADRAFQLAYVCAYQLMRAYWTVRRPTTHGALVTLWNEGQ